MGKFTDKVKSAGGKVKSGAKKVGKKVAKKGAKEGVKEGAKKAETPKATE